MLTKGYSSFYGLLRRRGRRAWLIDQYRNRIDFIRPDTVQEEPQ